jgi:L,D-transpeptidase catalytic domain.
MKIFFISLLTIVFLNTPIYVNNRELNTDFDVERFNQEVSAVNEIINAKSVYNNKIAFLVDMKIKSGKNRFFIYDLINEKIIDQGLVAHGSGSETGIRGELKFSNVANSNCTSLGRYAIGNNYIGIFGKAYKLYGLDETNSNAFMRNIVLHQYSAVPLEEQDHYIVDSHGCPMVNEEFFKRIAKIIDTSKTKIILNIYY